MKEINNNLQSWGWNESLDNYFLTKNGENFEIGRVVKDSRHIYTLVTQTKNEESEREKTSYLKGEVSGVFRYKAVIPADFPTVGDWVLFHRSGDDLAVIEEIFPRKSCFSRKVAGSRTDEQILASNIDVIFLVFGLNGGRNFTASGLERYMTLAWESGAKPVVILNKSDLCSEEEKLSALLTTEITAPGVDIFAVSAATEKGLNELTGILSPGMTIALTGPSGVGKSTIINTLAGENLLKTNAQREGDQRGRHTTTHKEMFRLPSGVILIDTPGLKEVQLWAGEESLEETFSDIALLAEGCRFRDCSHQGEPGCAVQEALSTGELEYRRYENFLELQKELKFLKGRQEMGLNRHTREQGKAFAKMVKNMPKKQRDFKD